MQSILIITHCPNVVGTIVVGNTVRAVKKRSSIKETGKYNTVPYLPLIIQGKRKIFFIHAIQEFEKWLAKVVTKLHLA